jgi:hypothetical protein
MDPLKREHTLHKIVAVSGFLFALCVLPIAQHYIVGSDNAGGTVAGVSTDTSVTQADVAPSLTPEQCAAKQQKDLADIQRFYDGKKQHLYALYQTAVKPYTDTEASATLAPADKEALDSLIADEYKKYTDELAKVDAAVVPVKAAVTATTCGN